MSDNVVLKVQDLEVNFYNNERCNKVLRGVSFQLEKGKIMCIVGESGCGKSVTANSIMGLLPDLSRIEKGEIHFYDKGKDIRIDRLKRKGKEMREIRGDGIAMIFQDPMTALNPVFTVGYQINESLLYHNRAKSKSDAKEKAVSLLKDMGIPLPEKRVDEYPYQFSGGMCQRAMIAIAMVNKPKILIADEPTTALDVTVQAQITDLMKHFQKEFNMSIIYITHDMGVIAEMADTIAVMYLGRVVESGSARAIFKNPIHPYTKGLLKSMPVLGNKSSERLHAIEGNVPVPLDPPDECGFCSRCQEKTAACAGSIPPLVEVEPDHLVRCFHYQGE